MRPAEAASRLLLVEDDETIGGTLAASLGALGYRVTWRQTGSDALETAAGEPFDLVLLDLGLPDLDGLAVCRRLRADLPSAVLVMVTARTGEMDVAVGLEAGADDYLTKPVRLATLVARIRAHLRPASPAPAGEPAVRRAGELWVDRAVGRAGVGEREVALRPREFDLLAHLLATPDAVVSRQTLIARVWDENWSGPTRTLDVHVAALRRKLAAVSAGSAARIVTLRDNGFRLETPASAHEL